MLSKTILALLLGVSMTSAVYITTCHNDNECGTVCGGNGPDTVGASEGLFGTKCECQPGAKPVHKCNRDGINVEVCSDGRAPRCSVPCN